MKWFTCSKKYIFKFPEEDPTYPHVVVDDTIGERLYLVLDEYQ